MLRDIYILRLGLGVLRKIPKRENDIRVYADELGKGLVGESDSTLEAANASEFRVAAYYYHGLIPHERHTEKSHGMAVAALQAADECFKESKKAFEAFNTSSSTSRPPPLFGTMKYLTQKILKDTSSKVRINRDVYTYEKIMETTPTFPDFAYKMSIDTLEDYFRNGIYGRCTWVFSCLAKG